MLDKVALDERAQKICDLFKGGMTQQLIGLRFGITRQMVSKILKDRGVSNGGARVEKVKKQALRDASHTITYGCTELEFQELRHIGRTMVLAGASEAQTPIGAYKTQRNNAAKRGVPWKITLWEWWQIWQASGHWDQRGKAGYVMCRKGDTGPYQKDNVFIGTYVQNAIEAAAVPSKGGLPRGVIALKPNNKGEVRYGAMMRFFGKKRPLFLGSFKSVEEAAAAVAKRTKSKKAI